MARLSIVALIILGIPKFCCEYKLLCLRSLSTHSGGSSRLCSWSCLLFILYTTPLSSLISDSDSSCGHHLYADDTRLFISFAASDFSANIVHLQATIDLVSNWMSLNLLSLNQAKTEFLLIDLSAQLSKIADPTLLMPSNVAIVPADSAWNLGVIFDSTLSMSHHISSVSKSCYLIYPWPSEYKKHSRLHNCPHYCHISHSLKTRLLQLSVFEPSPVSTQSIASNSF